MATLVSDLITQSFIDMAVIQPGETLATTLLNAAFPYLNQLLATLSAEQLTVYTETSQTFAATGVSNYTVGASGGWNTTSRAQKIVGWKATSGLFTSGGVPLGLGVFDAAAQQLEIAFTSASQAVFAKGAALQAEVAGIMAPFFQLPVITYGLPSLAGSTVPMILGADTAWPLLNVKIFPAVTCSVELVYWTPIAAFASTGDTVNFPPGYEAMLHWALAVQLYPQYARVSGQTLEVIAGNAQQAKLSLVQQNTPNTGASQPQQVAA
jgi:hypothetical protein